MRILLGGYTADQEGNAAGIGVLHAGAPDSPLASGPLGTRPDAVTVAGSPSWIARHPTIDVVYAALEGAGSVRAFVRTWQESFTALGADVAVGYAVCHVAVSPDGRMLLASCWGDGRLVRLPLDAAGRLGAASVAPETIDPYGPDDGPSSRATDAVADARRALRTAVGDEYDDLLGGASDESAPDPATEPRAEGVPEARPSRAHQAIFLPRGRAASTDLGETSCGCGAPRAPGSRWRRRSPCRRGRDRATWCGTRAVTCSS
ncbi:beta-propeller fold lactonase family protein [Microbacterium sp.]|uniref:beta-propeller fold lactonase family protein n=1 Tax=Microbacterium sp. TaxID=51671 RepID=UPI003A899212